MDEEHMKDWERRLVAEVKELRLISEDIQVIRAHVREQMEQPTVPDFVMDLQLREEMRQVINFMTKYETVELN
jgi:hypothetical protein